MRLQNYSMAGAVALVGCSIFALAGAMVFATLGNSAQAGVGSAAPAVAAAAMAQGGGTPTIVWYGIAHSPLNAFGSLGTTYGYTIFARAWSDGKLEMKKVCSGNSCGDAITDLAGWVVVSNPNDGVAAFADLNADAKVDGVDLAQVLSRWGPAPRNDIPPSNCPLNLINP